MTIEVPDRYLHSPLVHAFVGNQIPVPSGFVKTQIPFSGTRVNEGGCFVFSPQPRFVAPEAGRYMIIWSMGLENTTTTASFAVFNIEVKSPTGVITQTLRPAGLGTLLPPSNAGTYCGVGGGGVVQMELNGYLEFYCFSGVNSRFFGGNSSGEWDYVQIFKLP